MGDGWGEWGLISAEPNPVPDGGWLFLVPWVHLERENLQSCWLLLLKMLTNSFCTVLYWDLGGKEGEKGKVCFVLLMLDMPLGGVILIKRDLRWWLSLLDGGWWGRWDEVPTAVRSFWGWQCPGEGMGVLVPKELVLGWEGTQIMMVHIHWTPSHHKAGCFHSCLLWMLALVNLAAADCPATSLQLQRSHQSRCFLDAGHQNLSCAPGMWQLPLRGGFFSPMFSDAASKTPATWARQSFPKSISVASLGPAKVGADLAASPHPGTVLG